MKQPWDDDEDEETETEVAPPAYPRTCPYGTQGPPAVRPDVYRTIGPHMDQAQLVVYAKLRAHMPKEMARSILEIPARLAKRFEQDERFAIIFEDEINRVTANIDKEFARRVPRALQVYDNLLDRDHFKTATEILQQQVGKPSVTKNINIGVSKEVAEIYRGLYQREAPKELPEPIITVEREDGTS